MTDTSLSTAIPTAESVKADSSGHEQRILKLQQLVAAGYQPYGAAFESSGRLSEIRAAFAEGATVRAAGRLTTIRDMGKTIFADLHDGSGRFQLYLGIKQSEDFDGFKQFLDAGDQVGVTGELFVTRMGEQTIKVKSWVLLSKSLWPLPEKWHGLKDVEIRYRQRYLDLIANPEVRTLFNQRHQIVREIRKFLWERGFHEVETPMMQPQAGGAAARPFKTHYTALNADMFLRIAPELYLKRLLVGGFDKVFELNRNFRNEGLSKSHNPEFTMLEVYQAFSDRRGIQSLVMDMIVSVAQTVMGTRVVGEGEQQIDLTPPWREVPYRELIAEKMGADWYQLPVEMARARATALGLVIDPAWDLGLISHEIYEKLVEKSIKQPTFVIRLPRDLVPLAKTCADDPSVVDVYELVIGGKEISPGYSELNDPQEQRKRFEQQVGDDAQSVDEEFLLALEHGMPPAGGAGIGIDRLVMILTGSEVIRDVILFPQLKPKHEAMP